jgi:hypothetical protein
MKPNCTRLICHNFSLFADKTLKTDVTFFATLLYDIIKVSVSHRLSHNKNA